MILSLAATGEVALLQPSDFKRLHIEVAAGLDLAAVRRAFKGLAEIESSELGWIDQPAFFALGVATGGADWLPQAEAMVAGAARHGWVRAQPPSIRSHLVWRP